MTAPGPSPGARSVLLAEHEPEVAEMSARYLRRDGLLVRLVTTPEQALAELTAGPDAVPVFDLTVLDLTMPGLDPRRIRRALRTPVIFLVAGPQGPRPRGLARAGTTGPRRWLARPFGPRQLVAMVRDVLATPARWPAGDAGETAGRVGGELEADADRDRRPGGPDRPAGARAVPSPAARRRGASSGRRPGRRRGHRPAQGQDGGAGTIRTVRGVGYAIDH